MTDTQRRAAAKQFATDWKARAMRRATARPFGCPYYRVDEPDKLITFEDQIMLDHTSFIDDLILSTHVLIEQKSYLDR